MRSQSSHGPFSTKWFSASFDVPHRGSVSHVDDCLEQVGESWRVRHVHIPVCTLKPCCVSPVKRRRKNIYRHLNAQKHSDWNFAGDGAKYLSDCF